VIASRWWLHESLRDCILVTCVQKIAYLMYDDKSPSGEKYSTHGHTKGQLTTTNIIVQCWYLLKLVPVYSIKSYTLDHEGLWGWYQLGFCSRGTQGVMWLAPCLTAFDSLLCRYPSELGGLVVHQKSQAQTCIQTGDPRHGSVVSWPVTTTPGSGLQYTDTKLICLVTVCDTMT